ncbi:plasmid pRiA4b ORF-3 family protein [Desulfonatronospira thiodismutans]|nr:plasmid pRiA4b ORF-3 family protein [Desulfonatronospira thiodismutans]
MQNIAEGSKASGTSKKIELKLTNVARASLEELRLDYVEIEHSSDSRIRHEILGRMLDYAAGNQAKVLFRYPSKRQKGRAVMSQLIYQFYIRLQEIEPPIWRRIQVPDTYTFWGLHVAIQDAMGWLDYHLHAFRFRPKHKRDVIEIGIPSEKWDDLETLPGWDIKLDSYLHQPGQWFEYEYDFGDGWMHDALFEGLLVKEKGSKYPKCLGGERACPPEDCGGVRGYYQLLDILNDPDHEDHQEMVAWLKGHLKKYYPYNPDMSFALRKCAFPVPQPDGKKPFWKNDVL